MKTTVERDCYNAIRMNTINEKTRKQIRNLFTEAASAEKVDEHGAWDFGCEFDDKGRGSALNWDLYGFGRDIHSKRLLIVVQIRQFIRRYKNGFGNVRKSYFLIGRNEDNTAFAHAIESRVIHSAINTGRDVVKAVQDWIFGCDYSNVIRQGDLALVPVRKVNTEAKIIEGNTHLLEDSHQLTASDIRKNGVLYALDPALLHIPGTHPAVSAKGWYKVIVGKRASHWDFAAPTID